MGRGKAMRDPYSGPDRFCSGCRTWVPEYLVEPKLVEFRHGETINYYCRVCAEKLRVQAEKRKAAA